MNLFKLFNKLIKLHHGNALPKVEIERAWDRERISDYIMIEAYDPETGLFLTRDDYVCSVMECYPKIMPGEETIQTLIDVYSGTLLPQKSVVQVMLLADTYIEPLLDSFVGIRKKNVKSNIEDDSDEEGQIKSNIDESSDVWLKDYSDFLLKRKYQQISDVIEVPTRNFRLFVTYKVPCTPEEYRQRREHYVMLHRNIKTMLEASYFFPAELNPAKYIKLMSILINPSHDPTFNEHYSPDQPVYEQVVDGDNGIFIGKDYIKFDDFYGKCVTIKGFSSTVTFGDVINFAGDLFKNKLQINTPFFLNFNAIVPDDKVLMDIYKKVELLDRQKAASSLSTKLLQRQEEASWIMKKIENKSRIVKGYLTWFVWSPELEEVNKAAQSIKTILNIRGYKGQEELASVNLLLFLQSLPGNANEEIITKYCKRARTMFDFNAAHLTPVQGDWKGTGTPVVPFVSRRGQIMFFNFFDGSEGYNACIAARTGSGKSFLTNHIVSAYYSMPDVSNIWIVDVGESYKATALLKNGEYMDFNDEADIQINPFVLTNEEQFQNDIDILLKIVGKMAKPTEMLNDTEKAILEFAMQNAFSKYRQHTTIDSIVEELNLIVRENPDEIKRDTAALLATNLYRWTSQGAYGKFVNRGFNVNLFNKLTVLELRHLKQKPDLKSVVLMLLFYAIIKIVILDDDRTKKKLLIFDEAWQFLDDLQTAKFIEEAYRTFRKHGASIISITQGVQDFYKNEATQAMFFQASYILLLAQKPENIQILKKEEKLVLSEYDYQVLNSLRTVKGAYSEIFFITPLGRGVGRLIVPPLSYWQYTSDAKDVSLRTQMIEKYGIAEGLRKCVEYTNMSTK